MFQLNGDVYEVTLKYHSKKEGIYEESFGKKEIESD